MFIYLCYFCQIMAWYTYEQETKFICIKPAVLKKKTPNTYMFPISYYNSFVPLLLRGPLTDLRKPWWVYVGGPRNCPWGVLFWKAQRVNGSNVTFSEQMTPGWDHTAAKGVPSKRHTASKSLIPWMGIFTSWTKWDNTGIIMIKKYPGFFVNDSFLVWWLHKKWNRQYICKR